VLGLGLVRAVLRLKWLVVVGLVAAAYEGWSVLRPKPWAPNDFQKAAADAICWQAAKGIPAELPGITKVAVLRLDGRDADGSVTAKLAECIQRVGRYEVLHDSFVGNLMKELGIDAKPVSTLAEAAKAGKRMGVSGVVFGEVAELASDEASASIRLDLRVANVERGDSAFGESFAAKEPPSAASVAGVQRSIRASSVVKRLLIWLAFAALVPIILIPIIKHFLEQESNAVNFALLVALTLADLALAYVLCGLAVFEWLPAALLVGSVIAGGAYNYWLCETVERLRK
jgi:hypothetical protein